jgi:hypothetical protein
LRLPLGRHTWTGKRGKLIIPYGEVLDLDTGAETLEQALEMISSLPVNEVQELPEAQPKVQRVFQTSQNTLRGEGDPIADTIAPQILSHFL